jgi:ribosomal protein S12 methylthiotransferase
MISLGCAKNLVDAEIMLGSVLQGGLEITNDPATADVLIINTCSFIDAAQEESVDTILESAALREAKLRGQALVVAGCLSQRYRDELPALLPEVDAFMGIDQVTQVPEIVQRAWQRRRSRERIGNAISAKAPVLARLANLDKKRTLSAGDSPRPAEGKRKERTKQVALPRPNVGLAKAEASSPVLAVNARPNYIPDYTTPRFRLTPRHFAYVKIAEGCNHPCSFCTIPQMRGGYRSRALADVVEEVRNLIREGVREFNLISQDSTYYGLDLRPVRQGSIAAPERFVAATRSLPAGATTLSALLRELDSLAGDFWVRLLYTHPAHWTDELIQTLASCSKVVKYVDMPLQHIHGLMLERMRRETSRKHIEDLIAKLRDRVPGIALRSTFIVGFPGETLACFESLLEFVRNARFERLGVFTYSREEGTRAGRMAGHIPPRTRRRRRDLLMGAQREVSREMARSQVGRRMRVLVEGEASRQDLAQVAHEVPEHGVVRTADERARPLRGHFSLARGEADAPDIDGRVYVRGNLASGHFAWVRVTGHTDYDLIAEPSTVAV